MTEYAAGAADTIECPFCITEIPAEASRCAHCTADLNSTSDGPSLTGFWIGGFVLVIAGVAMASSEDTQAFGLIVASVGAVLLQIAVIAAGVSIGLRDRDQFVYARRLGNAAAKASEPAED